MKKIRQRKIKICFHLYIESKMEKAMGTHSSTLAWKIPWMEEPDGLQSMGSLKVGHDWVTSLSLFTFMHWRYGADPYASVLCPHWPAAVPEWILSLHKALHSQAELLIERIFLEISSTARSFHIKTKINSKVERTFIGKPTCEISAECYLKDDKTLVWVHGERKWGEIVTWNRITEQVIIIAVV